MKNSLEKNRPVKSLRYARLEKMNGRSRQSGTSRMSASSRVSAHSRQIVDRPATETIRGNVRFLVRKRGRGNRIPSILRNWQSWTAVWKPMVFWR